MTPPHVSLNAIESFWPRSVLRWWESHVNARISAFLYSKNFSVADTKLFPVNPNTQEMLGQKCFARVQEIQPPPDAALHPDVPVDHQRCCP